jgi:stearoyl-CoA desaturase (delta-9 desaturase)
VHHRYTDTPKDPYNAKNGFFWAHMGWMLVKMPKEYRVQADIRDLQADPLLNFQHKFYLPLGLLMAFGVPTAICHFGWNDWMGGLFYVGICRLLFVHHSTFCVNSMAHFFGAHTYDDDRTPRDHLFTAFVTLGEGYHNFHHEFPNDYRNGIRFYDYDPTKWLILGCSLFGLTYNLKEFPANEVTKGQLTMQQKHLDREKAKLKYPGPIGQLPAMSWDLIRRKVREGQALVVVDGLVHDVANFLEEHPGGMKILQAAIGQDATSHFRGETGIYRHSNAARHLLTTFRVGRLEEDANEKKANEKKVNEKKAATAAAAAAAAI